MPVAFTYLLIVTNFVSQSIPILTTDYNVTPIILSSLWFHICMHFKQESIRKYLINRN